MIAISTSCLSPRHVYLDMIAISTSCLSPHDCHLILSLGLSQRNGYINLSLEDAQSFHEDAQSFQASKPYTLTHRP